MEVSNLIKKSESGTKHRTTSKRVVRVSEGGQHVEALLVNADRLGSTGHSLAFVRIPRASNTTAGAGNNGRDLKPRGSPADAQRKIKSTEDQKAKLKPILQDQAQQLRALRDDPSLSPEQKSAKKKIVHELTHDQINSVLTPEQQDKFKQMKQDAMEKHKEMNH